MRKAENNNKRKQTPSMYENLPSSKYQMSDISSIANNDNNIIKNQPKTSAAAAEINEVTESDGELPDLDFLLFSKKYINLHIIHIFIPKFSSLMFTNNKLMN